MPQSARPTKKKALFNISKQAHIFVLRLRLHVKFKYAEQKNTKFFHISADKIFEVIIVIINGAWFHSDHITDIYKNNGTAKTGPSFSNALKSKMGAAGRTDTIEISNDAKTAGNNCSALGGIKAKIESDMLHGTDKTKLKNIKAQIENGSYKIDSSEIAARLLGDDF